MKKILILIILPFITSVTYAQMSSISGVAKNIAKGETEISLFSIADGTTQKIATTKYGEDGSFGFLFKVNYETFYVVGGDKQTGAQYFLYLKPGDDANILIDGKTISFIGKNTSENKVIDKWNLLTSTCKLKSFYFLSTNSNFEDFYPDFDKLLAGFETFLKQIKTPNALFNLRMAKWSKYERDMIAFNMMVTPRSKHPNKDELHSFCKNLEKPSLRYPSDDIFDYMYGSRLLNSYIMIYTMGAGIRGDDLDGKIANVATDRQKGEIIASGIGRIKNFSEIDEISKEYGKYFVTESLKLRLEAKARELFNTKSGSKAIDFTYPDTSGKSVSLSDFKGKVVLVDVWATWCGPCKQQIPFMKELEEEYKNKDIVFLSISVDENDKKQDWLNMIKEKDMKGVHLFASGWSKICKDYNITGIPRFMVFDKLGNVVSIDSPRPSNPQLKEILNRELAK